MRQINTSVLKFQPDKTNELFILNNLLYENILQTYSCLFAGRFTNALLVDIHYSGMVSLIDKSSFRQILHTIAVLYNKLGNLVVHCGTLPTTSQTKSFVRNSKTLQRFTYSIIYFPHNSATLFFQSIFTKRFIFGNCRRIWVEFHHAIGLFFIQICCRVR